MRKQGLDFRVLLGLLVLVVIAGGIALLTVGGGSSSSASQKQAKQDSYEAAAVVSPIEAAPPLSLRNYLGERVNIASYKGKAVLVTFLYTNCPDVCPLIASNLRVAENLLGQKGASKVQLIAVSVDPRGDTRKAVATFLARHELTGKMKYLIGSASELGRVWQAWGVGSERDAQQPQFINHSGLVYGVSGSGKRITVYDSTFRPSEVAHDVPLLAAH
jgi:protein SCO1